MTNETKHRPSEVLLQLMRFTWDPTFEATDLDITMGEAMEVYRATVAMETKMAAAEALREKPEEKPGKKARGAAAQETPRFTGVGAQKKQELHVRLSALFDAHGPDIAETLAEATNGTLSSEDILVMKKSGCRTLTHWRILGAAMDSIEPQDTET